MSDKEVNQAEFQEYIALKEDPAIQPFLKGLGALFEQTAGHEDAIILLLELTRGRLGSGVYNRKKKELAQKLGIGPAKTERHLYGIRAVYMGRKFAKQKPHQIIEADEN